MLFSYLAHASSSFSIFFGTNIFLNILFCNSLLPMKTQTMFYTHERGKCKVFYFLFNLYFFSDTIKKIRDQTLLPNLARNKFAVNYFVKIFQISWRYLEHLCFATFAKDSFLSLHKIVFLRSGEDAWTHKQNTWTHKQNIWTYKQYTWTHKHNESTLSHFSV